VKVLLENGANINGTVTNRESPLHCAAKWSRYGVLKHLLERGANVNQMTECFDNALTSAVYEKHMPIIKLLLDYGADPNYQLNHKDTFDRQDIDENDFVPIYIAAQNGSLEAMEQLLKYNADPNTKFYKDQSPLYKAAVSGHHQIVTELLENGAKINEINTEDQITGKFFSKVKLSLVISTTFEFSRKKLNTKILKNGTFQSIPNEK